jgi:hypothetical protein
MGCRSGREIVDREAEAEGRRVGAADDDGAGLLQLATIGLSAGAIVLRNASTR